MTTRQKVLTFLNTPLGGTCIQFVLITTSLILGLAHLPGSTVPIWILLLMSVSVMYWLMRPNPGITPSVSRDEYLERVTAYVKTLPNGANGLTMDTLITHLLDDNEALWIQQQTLVEHIQHSSNQEGIIIKGWWCLHPTSNGVACDTFNGEEKEKHTECRRCGHPKANPRISSESAA